MVGQNRILDEHVNMVKINQKVGRISLRVNTEGAYDENIEEDEDNGEGQPEDEVPDGDEEIVEGPQNMAFETMSRHLLSQDAMSNHRGMNKLNN